jgi:hypothetical protein
MPHRPEAGHLVRTLVELDRLDPHIALEVGLVAEDAGDHRLGFFPTRVEVLDIPRCRARAPDDL